MSCYCHCITCRDRKDLYKHIVAHTRNREADPRKGGKERMHPSYENHTYDDQNPETLPAAFLIPIPVNIEDVFDRGKSHGSDSGIDDTIKNGIEFLAKHQENGQNGQTLQPFLDDRRNNGCRSEFSYICRAGYCINTDAKYCIEDVCASACDNHAPHEGGAKQKFRFLFIAVQPVHERREK